jgi:hypothetical protein
MTYEYKLDNFLAKPINGDKRLIISDKNGNFVDSIITDISHFFVKNNCLVIKITNKNDLILSFESTTVAQQALEKLDLYRKTLLITNSNLTRTNVPTLNTLNRNMLGNSGTTIGADPWSNPVLATFTPVMQQPLSRVDVIIRGTTHVECGKPISPLSANPYGCYFTSPSEAGNPDYARVNDGDVQIGDLLYWVSYTANFDLDDTDWIDLSYLF